MLRAANAWTTVPARPAPGPTWSSRQPGRLGVLDGVARRHRQDAAPAADITHAASRLGRDAWHGSGVVGVPIGNTPEQAYRRVLRGIEDGDPQVLDAWQPPSPVRRRRPHRSRRSRRSRPRGRGPGHGGRRGGVPGRGKREFRHEAERLARDHLHPGCGHLPLPRPSRRTPAPPPASAARPADGPHRCGPPAHAAPLRGSRHNERRQGIAAGKKRSPRRPESGKARKIRTRARERVPSPAPSAQDS